MSMSKARKVEVIERHTLSQPARNRLDKELNRQTL